MEFKHQILKEFPEGATFLHNQVAGHEKGFYEFCDGTIWKRLQKPPRGSREMEFYKEIFTENGDDSITSELRKYLPKFLGTVQLENSDVIYLHMNNFTAKYNKPCIMDIKMGQKTSDPDATAEKIAHEKSKGPLREKIGFQICGMRKYYQETDTFKQREKPYSRSFNEEEVLSKGFQYFFPKVHKQCIIKNVLHHLQHIQTWFQVQRRYSFYSSSLCIVYEGLSERYNTACDGFCTFAEDLVSIHMIDMAHVFLTTEQDDNYLYGLNKMITCIQQVQ